MLEHVRQTIAPCVVLLCLVQLVSSRSHPHVVHVHSGPTCEASKGNEQRGWEQHVSVKSIVIPTFTPLSGLSAALAPPEAPLGNPTVAGQFHESIAVMEPNIRNKHGPHFFAMPPEAPREGALWAPLRVATPPPPPPEAAPPNRSASVTARPPLAARAAASSAPSAAVRAAQRWRCRSTQLARILSIHTDGSALNRDRS